MEIEEISRQIFMPKNESKRRQEQEIDNSIKNELKVGDSYDVNEN